MLKNKNSQIKMMKRNNLWCNYKNYLNESLLYI